MSIFDERGDVRPGRVFTWLALVVVAAIVITWIVIVAGAKTSGTRGTLDIQRERGTAANREHWSAVFTSDYQQIQADQQGIKTLAAVAAGAHATSLDATNLTGAELNCQQDVAKYNGEFQNILAIQPDGYPSSINATQVCAANTTGLVTP